MPSGLRVCEGGIVVTLELNLDLGGKDSLGVSEASDGLRHHPLAGLEDTREDLPSIMPNHYGLREVYFVYIERQRALGSPLQELGLDLEGIALMLHI